MTALSEAITPRDYFRPGAVDDQLVNNTADGFL
jgi:hypothetical protein